MAARCEQSVHRAAAVVGTIPASPVKDWMSRITAQFNAELDDVRALARAMGAVHEDHPASQRLFAAARDFAAFENEVSRVALKMFDHPELDRAHGPGVAGAAVVEPQAVIRRWTSVGSPRPK